MTAQDLEAGPKGTANGGGATGKRFAIPLSALLLLTSLLVAGAIVIPVVLLAYGGANDTVDVVVSVLRESYAQQVTSKVSDSCNTIYKVMNGLASHRFIRPLIDGIDVNNPPDFSANNEFMFSFYAIIQPFGYMLSAGFTDPPRTTSVLVPILGQLGIACNHTTPSNPICNGFFTTGADLVAGTLSTQPAFPLDNSNPGTLPTAPQGDWDRPAIVPVGLNPDNTTKWLSVLALNWGVWRGVPLGGDPGAADFLGHIAIGQDLAEYSSLLANIPVTPNTIISIWDHRSMMIAANRDGLTFNATSGVAYDPASHPLDVIAVPARAAIAATTMTTGTTTVGNWSAVPAALSQTHSTSIGQVWTELRALRDEHSLQWFVLICIPESDIMGPIVASRKKVIGTSVGVAVCMLAFAAATSFFVTAPLRKLTGVMQQATGMDFSALQSGYLNQRARINEIASMQGVFSSMMEKFAAQIKANRALASRGAGAGQGSAGAAGSGLGTTRELSSPNPSAPLLRRGSSDAGSSIATELSVGGAQRPSVIREESKVSHVSARK
ncbi:hypothetical protein HDU87_003985 [Geranomyces variabilis]|uniref:Uncharacterized protein n=1 Tax=Geranomyces variabilis TaxID=109894 RepID=A0AAD5TT51_9FUNG|nr:hypothetical protein HDU87_003985 [Geranomyces variabilis]